MVACGFIDEIIITSFPEYFTIMFLTSSGTQKQHQQYISYDDRKGLMKNFRTAKALYSKIDEILNWPVNPEIFHTLDASCIHFNFNCSPSMERSISDKQMKLPI